MKVKKEVTVAVIIGLILGVITVGGVLRARTAIMKVPSLAVERKMNLVQPSESPNNDFFLSIETPDNQVLKTPSIVITGKTLPGTYIVINGEAGDSIIVPNELGSFSQEISLIKGANSITVTAYQENGSKQETSLTAIYTTAEI